MNLDFFPTDADFYFPSATNANYNDDADALFDSRINNIEVSLTNIAIIPVPPVCTLAGAALAAASIAQILGSLIIAASTQLSFSENYGNEKLSTRAWTHLKHGLATLSTCPTIMIPFYGSVISYLRWQRSKIESQYTLTLITGHENKLYPYQSLVEKDWRIGGTNSALVHKAEERYNLYVNQHVHHVKTELTPELRMELAQKAIDLVRNSPEDNALDTYKESLKTTIMGLSILGLPLWKLWK
jgi:hypothetical protein